MTQSTSIPELYDHVIDDGRLQLIEKLGQGGYGVVYRAVDLNPPTSSRSPDPAEYAVKVLVKANPQSRHARIQHNEIAAHKILSGRPHILKLHKVIEDGPYIFLVTDYCPGGDMFMHITERKTYGGRTGLIKNVFIQIIDAVHACHEQGIAHRDLKPDNIFCLNEDGSRVVLGDFGLATTSHRSRTFGCGSPFYTSPETIGTHSNYRPYDAKVADVWALGVILVNMVAGRNPWSTATIDDQCFLRSMTKQGYLQKMLPISGEAATILQRIFTYDPKMRITLPDLRSAILTVKTFFMTKEQLATSDRFAQITARQYFQKYYSPSTEDCRELEALEEDEFGKSENTVDALVVKNPAHVFRLVDRVGSSKVPSLSNNEFDSDVESAGPITPARNAVDSEALDEIPPMEDGENMGESTAPAAGKRRGSRFGSIVEFMQRLAA